MKKKRPKTKPKNQGKVPLLHEIKLSPSLSKATIFTDLAAIVLPEAIFPAAIVVEHGKIADIGPSSALLAKWRGRAKRVDAQGYIAIPGLINSHTHAPMGFFRDRAHGRDQMIETYFFPMERNLSARLVEPLSYSHLIAGLFSGTTSFVDHYYFSDSVARAIEMLGLRGAIGETVADLGGAFPSKDAWRKARDSISKWKHSSRIRPVVAPHAADTVSSQLLSEMASYARANKIPLHMHLAQTKGEEERVRARDGMSAVEKAARAQAIYPESLLVHMIAASDSDLDLVASEGGNICLSPAAQILYESLAPLEKFLARRISLTLGTDSAAANDGADLFQEMRITALLLRDRSRDEKKDFAREVFAMATSTPGRIFFADEVGTLAAGKKADIAFIRHSISNAPVSDWFTNLVYSVSSSQVEHVMVDGQWRLFRRAPLNFSLSTLAKRYEKAVAEVLKRLPKDMAPKPIKIL